MSEKGVPKAPHKRTSVLGNEFVAGRGAPKEKQTEKDRKRASSSAAAVHGMTGLAFQKIPYTPSEVDEMEKKSVRAMRRFSKSKATKDLKDQFDAERNRMSRTEELTIENNGNLSKANKVIYGFEKNPGSGITEKEYNAAKNAKEQLVKEAKRLDETRSEAKKNLKKLQRDIKKNRDDYVKSLMEDPSIRYVVKSGGDVWRQHIDTDGNTGGLVADGANVSPEAHVCINSTIRGKGLIVEPGVQITNSDIDFSQPATRGAPGGRIRNPFGITPHTRRNKNHKVTIDANVSDSNITWKKSGETKWGTSMTQVTQPRGDNMPGGVAGGKEDLPSFMQFRVRTEAQIKFEKSLSDLTDR